MCKICFFFFCFVVVDIVVKAFHYKLTLFLIQDKKMKGKNSKKYV